jgi:conjugative transfer signal peptidase TraF
MRMNRRLLLYLSIVAAAALIIVAALDFAPRIVWNGSKSAPRGVYFIRQTSLERGQYMLVDPRPDVKAFIEKRSYLPPDTPLIKRIAGLSGDEICREDDAIFINKNYTATALKTDAADRFMPRWSGCFTLQKDEIFLLNPHQKSIDGRYFGATKRWRVIGVAVPLWVWK